MAVKEESGEHFHLRSLARLLAVHKDTKRGEGVDVGSDRIQDI